MRIPNASVDRYIYFVAVDVTDLKTRKTGLTTFTVYYSLDGGVSTAMTTPTINEASAANMPGVYELLIDEASMTSLAVGHDSEELALHITQASMASVTRVVEIYRPETTEGKMLTVDSAGKGRADVFNWLGVSVGALVGGRVDCNVGAMANDVMTAAAFATNAVGAAEFAADAAVEIAAAVWDEARAAHVAAGSFGEGVAVFGNVTVGDIVAAALAKFFTVNSGSTYAAAIAGSVVKEIADNAETILRVATSQAGSATTITLDVGASAVDDYYKHSICALTAGTGSGQAQIINSYVGATKVATMAAAWATAPDATSVFHILPLGTIPGATAPTAAVISDQILNDLSTQKLTVDRATGDIAAYKSDLVTVRGTRRITEIDANTQGLIPQ